MDGKFEFHALDHPIELRYAVIAAFHNGKYVFVRHSERDTLELPGGHRETGEDILQAAKRELYEETGALLYDIAPVCIYSITNGGMLFYADIKEFGELPEFEIAEVILLDNCPENWTYPHAHPRLLQKAEEYKQSLTSGNTCKH